ncbi:MAG: pyruvate kinase, partial [Oscillospiraceae bacterium]|nr:pyruvate kinase [Oscillospiraceae bacterium]
AKTFHQLSLCWGVYPVLARLQSDSEALFYHAVACAKQMDAVQDGDRVVITAGMPLNTAGTTNTLKVTVVGSGE